MTAASAVVIDTNIALDLWVFCDPVTEPLRQAISDERLRWLATAAMREELARVLAYPQILRRLQRQDRGGEQVLQAFDRCAHIAPEAPKTTFTCKDPDDQKFIDLAVAHRAVLLSKDAAVLCMARRLSRLGVAVHRQWPHPAVPDRLR
jgi:putative PIN family toxin of toxin-antitoxin system